MENGEQIGMKCGGIYLFTALYLLTSNLFICFRVLTLMIKSIKCQDADIVSFCLQVHIAMAQQLNQLTVRLVVIAQMAPCQQRIIFVQRAHLTTVHHRHSRVPVHNVGLGIIVKVKV